MRLTKTQAVNIIEGDHIQADHISGTVIDVRRKWYSRYMTVIISPRRSNKIHRVILDKTQHVIISK